MSYHWQDILRNKFDDVGVHIVYSTGFAVFQTYDNFLDNIRVYTR